MDDRRYVPLFFIPFVTILAIGASLLVVLVEAESGVYKSTQNPFLISINASASQCHARHELEMEKLSSSMTWHPSFLWRGGGGNKRKRSPKKEPLIVERLTPNTWRVVPDLPPTRRSAELHHNRTLEARIIVHMHREVDADQNMENTCEEGGSLCWGPISEGVRWRTQPRYNVNSANSIGVDPSSFLQWLEEARQAWNGAAGCTVWGEINPSIVVDGGDFDAPDWKNEILFSNLGDPNTLAIVVSWIDTSAKEIVESDMIFNTGAGSYPVDRVALHEMGHMFGLKDIYSSLCSHVIMYGYIETSSSFHGSSSPHLSSDDVEGAVAICGC